MKGLLAWFRMVLSIRLVRSEDVPLPRATRDEAYRQGYRDGLRDAALGRRR